MTRVGTNSAINYNSVEVDPSPVNPPGENPALAYTLIVALQRTSLSCACTPDPQKQK